MVLVALLSLSATASSATTRQGFTISSDDERANGPNVAALTLHSDS